MKEIEQQKSLQIEQMKKEALEKEKEMEKIRQLAKQVEEQRKLDLIESMR